MTDVEVVEALRRIACEMHLMTWALIALAVAMVLVEELEHRGRAPDATDRLSIRRVDAR